MSDLGQWLFLKQQETIKKLVDRSMPRTGVVQSLSATGVTVVDPLTGDTESEILVPAGFATAAGDRVIIVPLADGSRVTLPLGSNKRAYHYGPLTILDDTSGAFRVQSLGSVNRLVLDSAAPQLELWNSTDLALYSDNGGTNVGRWDAATGSIIAGQILDQSIRGSMASAKPAQSAKTPRP